MNTNKTVLEYPAPQHTYDIPENAQGVSVRFLTRDRLEDWVVFPIVEQRIKKFVHEFGESRTTAEAIKNIATCWATGTNTVALWAGMYDGEVVGHLVAGLVNDGSEVIVFCWQAESDIVVPDISQAVWLRLKDWGLSHKCTIIRMETPRRQKNAFATAFGFVQISTIHEARIDDHGREQDHNK